MKTYLKIISFFVGLYLFICLILYFNQENFVFYPTKFPIEKEFSYSKEFTEINLLSKDGTNLNNIYFELKNPKGVIYFLHGNAGNLSTWGNIADLYLENGYNVFINDYRGYGKSEGKIINQTQLFDDAQLGYDFLKEKFNEENIIIIGYSIGTGISSFLASTNNPKTLILQAPYYNLQQEMKSRIPFVPKFILKYKLENNLYLSNVKCPVYIFHGTKDQVINYENSLKLKPLLKNIDQYITLKNQDHHDINKNNEYKKHIENILK